MLTTFGTAGIALAVMPMVALVTTPARACPPATPIPNPPHNRTTDSKYLAGISNIYMPGANRRSVGRCSASFLCFKNDNRFYTDISNYISVDNGLIVSWLTPTTLIDLELDSIINGMVTECIVVAATKIGPNPFYGETFNLVVSSDGQQIQFEFTQITS